MTKGALAGDFADLRVRPVVWRLPLMAVVIVGLLVLNHLDRLLVREYATEAQAQALQTEALLESFLRHRLALIHSERALIAAARTTRESRERFQPLASQILSDAPDMRWLCLLDHEGVVIDCQRRSEDSPPAGASDMRFPERAEAIYRARETHDVAVTPSLPLSRAGRGMIAYVPVVRAGRVVALIGGAFDYQALFNDALAGQLQGQFAYRIRDGLGEVIALSPDYPERVSAVVNRDVTFSGSSGWTLDLPIPAFEPLVPRLVTWVVGLLLLSAVVLLVIREEARARRFAAYSVDLELLSRDLLDANIRLEDRARQISEANRAKSRFLANVSHELRTPLNAIVGYNSLAIDGLYGDLPPQLSAAHERIRAAAEHLLALVDDVLDLSKIEVGRMEVDVQPTDVASLLDSVVTVIEPIAKAKGLEVDMVLGRNLPRLQTDARHVRQILLNLASNAVKFTERGCITLTARAIEGSDRPAVSIAVADTGIGIAAVDQERIFEEFEQVRPSARGDSLERGTGLGLAIARKLARLLGGDIVVESGLGQGARFVVYLPLVAPRIPRDHAETTHPAAESATAQGENSGSIDAEPETTDESTPTGGVPRADSAVTGEDSGAHALSSGPRASRGLDDHPVDR